MTTSAPVAADTLDGLPPRILPLLYLGTLGWITLSILGATYIVGPVVLRNRV